MATTNISDSEPVAWLGHDSITTFGHMTYGFIDRRDRAIPDSWIPLYTSPTPLLPLLKSAYRELHACQAVIHLAGGFDPAYVNDAQKVLRALEAVINPQEQP